MSNYKQRIGKWGENLGAEYLAKNGYKILDRNYRTPSGEIDLVVQHDFDGSPSLVFVEVKTRTSERFGYPEQAITRKKWMNLLNAIENYLMDHKQYECDWRIDVIAIQHLSPGVNPDLKHYENVIMPYGEDY